MDRETNGPMVVYSPAGGMDIETVAATNPELVFKVILLFLLWMNSFILGSCRAAHSEAFRRGRKQSYSSCHHFVFISFQVFIQDGFDWAQLGSLKLPVLNRFLDSV